MADTFSRTLPWNAPSTWIAILAAVIFLLLGARAVIFPLGAAAFFGVPIKDGAGTAFVQAFGGRNIGMALTALALIALDQRPGLAALLLSASLVAGIDAYAVAGQSGFAAATKHFIYLAGLAGFGIWIGLGK